MLNCWAQVFQAAAIGPPDRLFFAFSFAPFLGFWTAFESAAKLGVLSIPGGGLSSTARLGMIRENAITVLCCTPTYSLHLAEVAKEDTVERLEEEGVDAAGQVGESEPAQAIDDALVTFAADRIVIFSHPEGDRDYREDEGLAAGEARWNVPVTHAVISR